MNIKMCLKLSQMTYVTKSIMRTVVMPSLRGKNVAYLQDETQDAFFFFLSMIKLTLYDDIFKTSWCKQT